ncbi:FG-GAP-like repeat-containing protein [Pontimicrobium sp. MEBiC01747]
MKNIYTLIFLAFSTIGFAQLAFEEVATLKGVGASYGASTYGGGVSFCDFDGDGWDDLTYSTTDGEKVYFYKNQGGTFTQVDLVGIDDTYRAKQVLWVDYDNDGDKDFMVTSITGLNKFYRNAGDMTFTDVSSTIGFFTDNFYTYGISFGDIDSDGDLDAFISNRDDQTFNQYSYLYRNDNGTFVNISSAAGIYLGNQLSFCSAFFDYDNDGDQDIYVANDKLANMNRLYQNDGNGNFTDVSVASGAGITIDAMSTTIGDYNNDGWFDIYVSNTTSGNYLLKNNGDGTFSNVSASVGTEMNTIAWGSSFLDADNDTDLDLYVSSSIDSNGPPWLNAAMYINNNNGNNFAIPSGAGFSNDTRKSYANAMGDFNNDGLADIVVMNDTENNFLWQNKTNNSNNYLKVKLEGVVNNKDGIGSKIEISIGGNKQYRYTLCGEGYLGQNSGTEIFGLGTATTVDYVKVTWLNGVEDVFNNVSANQTLNIVEGSSLSVEEFNTATNISVHPNPTKGLVSVSNLKEDVTLTIYNILGKQIVKQSLSSISNTVNISNYPKGIYLFTFKNKQGLETTKKVVLQ